jgi:hypothetical protein
MMMATAQQQPQMAAEWGLQAPEFKTMLESMNLQSWLAIGQTYELLRQVSRMPYPRQPRPLPTPEDHFAKIIMPAADLILFKEAQSRTALHVREAELAVRAYLLEKGHLPPSLTALAPEYVAELPSDPFGEGPLLSKLIGGKLVIYSVGPDLKDDGGKQMDTRFPEPKSKGDITVEVTAKP